MLRAIFHGLVAVLAAAGAAGAVADTPDSPGLQAPPGSTFLPAPEDPYRSPQVTAIELPDFPGAAAIWGATGRDNRGHIWVGISAEGGDHSAHLIEYDPEAQTVTDRGDVLSQLRTAGLYREGEQQIKLHSRIIQADDGYLYFSSTDEQGEKGDGSAPPRWGSHLWRLQPGSSQWEHLLAVPEGLTAVSGSGRWIYALGLWDHVLYQYDTSSGDVARVVVGAPGGHMSRNLIADRRGHAFVPRVDERGAALVEYDTDLQELAATPLDNYLTRGKPRNAHGIIGLVHMRDGRMVINTHAGYLYSITPTANGASTVEPLGMFDPQGKTYSASLFTYSGDRYLLGATREKTGNRDKPRRYLWLVHDLERGRTQRLQLPIEEGNLGLFGSITRDEAGRFYVAGRHYNPETGSMEPLLLQLDSRD